MDKRKLGIFLLIVALVVSVVSLTLDYNTPEKAKTSWKVLAGENSANIQLTVESNEEVTNEQG